MDVAPDGALAAVEPGSPRNGATLLDGPVVPGMPNAHSHVAQRAIAGRTEGAGPDGDSFWSWRSAMYAFVERLTPDAFEALAAFTYAEMLEAGYTSVAEFHYLHHAADGTPYANAAEMSDRAVAAARDAGIGLTILPTLYRFSDAGGAAPLPHQRRFLHDRDAFCALTRDLATRYFAAPDVRVGTAFHSLRAVTPADVEALADALPIDADAPLHVHIAEQTREVEACVAAYGATPVDVLARTVELGPRWSLIHATHATDIELHKIARAGAAVVVCPTTEANLGDGVFPLAAFRAQRGRVAIGSDSNVTLDPAEELRWLEYAQRLAERRRHVFGAREGATLGDSLYLAALDAGAQSVGRPVGALAAGRRADLVVLAAEERDEPPSLDTRVFKSGAWRVADVVVGGEFRVRDGRHVARERLRARLARAERSQ